MPKFFVDKSAVTDSKIIISKDDARHIARALRMAVGDTVFVSDGCGTDYECRLARIRDDECVCDIIKSEECAAEPKMEITLFMAYPKGDKLETVIQKAVELGASRIIPFESSRCIKRPAADKSEKITQRLFRIAAEAAKQCGRGRLPRVDPAIPFRALCERISDYDLTLFCYEGEGTESLKTVLDVAPTPRTLGIIVGCEGGFSSDEAASIVARGARAVNLGPRILRCETAPSYVLSAVSYRYEL